MRLELQTILSYQPGWGSMQRVGLSPEGTEEIQKFSHASAMGSLFERYRYSQKFGKSLPVNVQRFHPVIICKLCRYACDADVDLETLFKEGLSE